MRPEVRLRVLDLPDAGGVRRGVRRPQGRGRAAAEGPRGGQLAGPRAGGQPGRPGRAHRLHPGLRPGRRRQDQGGGPGRGVQRAERVRGGVPRPAAGAHRRRDPPLQHRGRAPPRAPGADAGEPAGLQAAPRREALRPGLRRRPGRRPLRPGGRDRRAGPGGADAGHVQRLRAGQGAAAPLREELQLLHGQRRRVQEARLRGRRDRGRGGERLHEAQGARGPPRRRGQRRRHLQRRAPGAGQPGRRPARAQLLRGGKAQEQVREDVAAGGHDAQVRDSEGEVRLQARGPPEAAAEARGDQDPGQPLQGSDRGRRKADLRQGRKVGPRQVQQHGAHHEDHRRSPLGGRVQTVNQDGRAAYVLSDNHHTDLHSMDARRGDLAMSCFKDVEEETYRILQGALNELQEDKINKLQNLQDSRKQLNSIIDQINDLNRLIGLQEQQLEQEFQINVKQLKKQAVDHLKAQKQRIQLELDGGR